MKNQMFYLACLLYLFMGVARAEVIPQEVIPQVATPPTLESSWSESGHIRMARFYGSDQFADFWLQWDTTNLYIKGEIQDYTPSKNGGVLPEETTDGKRWNTHFDDNIEISISRNVSSRNVISFSPSGKLWKIDNCSPPSKCAGSTATHPSLAGVRLDNPAASIPSSYIQTSVVNNDKWKFMLSIPASIVGLSPFSLGDQLSINFYHNNIGKIGDVVGGGGKRTAPDFGLDGGDGSYKKLDGTKEYAGMPPNEWFSYKGDRETPSEWATFTLSAPDVQKPTVAKVPTPGFISVSPTGRSFELNGKPFVVVSETALMPWLPLRGLYNGTLCDEKYPDPANPNDVDGCKPGTVNIRSKQSRNYYAREIFTYPNVSKKEGKSLLSQTLLKREDDELSEFSVSSKQALKDELAKMISTVKQPKLDGITQQNYDAWVQLINNNQVPTCPTGAAKITDFCQAEGRGIAIRYFKELKKYGINTLSVFIESLDLNETPIIFGKSKDKDAEIFGFLDRLIKIAKDNQVYLILRLYDTYYYGSKFGQLGEITKKSPANDSRSANDFFEESNDSAHKNRMTTLFAHTNPLTGTAYSNEQTILGWDVVNEIDNGDRFNTASYEKRKKWVETMASHVQDNTKQLVFFSFLTWDPKDSNEGKDGKAYRGIKMVDATMAYRMPNIDFASPHTYYAHIANPGQLPTDDKKYEFLPAIELARGIAYGFYQIRDGRPILDTEGGPQELFVGNQYNILPDRLFNRKNDTEIFLNSIWTHFAAGGAGANTRWPHDLENNSGRTNQISPEWRKALWAFKNEVGNIPWDGNKLRVDHLRQNSAGQSPIIPQYDDKGIPTNSTLAGTTFTIARYDDKYAVVYAYNHDKQPLESIAILGDIAAKVKGGQAYVRAVEFGHTEDETLVYKLISNLNGASLQSVDVANKKFVLNSKVSDNVVLIISFDQALPPPSMIIPTDTPAPAPQPVSLPSPSLGVGVGMKGGMAVDPKGNSIPTGAKFAIGVSNDAVAKGQPITVRGNIQSDAKHNGTAELIVVALYKKSGTDCSAPKAGSEASEGYYVLGSKGYCRYIGESGKVNEGKQQSECYSTPRSKPVESWGADWQQWDGKLESLQSVKEIQLPITSDSIETLYDDLSVGYTGHVCLTFGYRLKGGDGSVFFNGDPIQFTVK